MKMKLFKSGIKNVLVLVVSLGLFACSSGGSSGAGSPPDPVVKTGVFLDSPVVGIHYKTESRSGETDSAGEFQYIEGETVTFSIGGIEFPSAKAKGTVTPLDLAGATDVKNQVVINIIRLLQTLDNDGNPENGIQITRAVHDAAAEVTIDFSLTVEEFEATVAPFLAANDLILISTESAIAHFEETIVSIKAKVLIGSWVLRENGDTVVLTFVDSSEYFMGQGNPNDPECNGMERGSYSWNPDTDAFSVTDTGNIVDTNGGCG